MNKLVLSLLMGISIFPVLSNADGEVKNYSCTVIVVADDLTDGSMEKTFDVLGSSASHGGNEILFEAENHEVTLLSNGKWMGISWKRDGELLAETVVARSDENQASQTMIVYNPANVDEQVSLSCSLKVN